MSKTKLPPLRADAVNMLEAVFQHLAVLDDLKAIAERHAGVLPDAFTIMLEGGEHCSLGGVNMRLVGHSGYVPESDTRFHAAATRLDSEKLPILEKLERLEENDAPLMDRLAVEEELAKAYARALTAILGS